ncbi:hypothetical protein [Actinomadura hibisca]|uniref:hypothetical protein n=1 Tax=Actinomadura hibisca TaxID=68565 RepID=UPI00082CCF50|nr:hypothetical protein [Actinomadura hibisca]
MNGSKKLCAWCGKPLSRYTTGDVCGPCVTAARYAPTPPPAIRLPLEFWFSEQVARALASWDWSTVLVTVHQHTNATQAAIAAQTGLSQGSISRLMAGRSGGQTIETALKLLDGLGAPRTLAGLAPKGLSHITGRTTDQQPGQAGRQNDVKRREFTSTLVLAGLSVSLIGQARPHPAADEGEVITGLQRPCDAVADLWALDAKHGGAALADLAEARLAGVLAQTKDLSLKPSQEVFLHAVIGEITSAAAWFTFESGNLNRAEQLLKDGLYAAHCANSTDLRLQILDTMAMVSSSQGKPAQALAVAQGALASSAQADPQLRALLAMRVSLGHARLGDQDGHRRLKGHAWDLLNKTGPRPDPDEWFRFFGEDELRGLEAIAQSSLGHHQRSAELLDGITATMAPRNRAFYRLCQATALAKAQDLRSSIEIFHGNLPLLTEMISARIGKKVRKYAAALAPHTDSDAQETRHIALSLIGDLPHA